MANREGRRTKPACQAGCADARRALRNTAGLGVLPLGPAPRCAAPASTVLARPLRDEGTVRLRVMSGEAFPAEGAAFPCAPALPPLGPAAPPCLPRSPGVRGWRSMIRQPSGPSSSLTLTLAPGLKGGVREREGVGGSAGGGGVSSMNQSWCAIRNSSTSWLSRCSVGESSCVGCDINPGRKITARSVRQFR
jgi:hypothetical protein